MIRTSTRQWSAYGFSLSITALDPEAPMGHSELEPLELTEQEKAQLIAFLKTLSGPLDADPEWLRPPQTDSSP